MGASQFNLKPADITCNLDVLSNLQEKQKLCSDTDGKITLDGKWLLVSLRRKFGALDIGAIETTFQKSIEFLRQDGTDDIALKNTIAAIKDKMNDAIAVGLVRQFKVYLAEDKKDSAKRFAKLILSTIEQYNKLNPNYSISINRIVKEQIELLLLDETLKKALVPVAPPPPKEKKERKSPELSDSEKRIQRAILEGTLSRSPIGFVMLENLGKVRLRDVGMRVLAEKRNREATQLFDQKLLDKARNKEEWHTVQRKQRGKAPLAEPVDDRLVVALKNIRANLGEQ